MFAFYLGEGEIEVKNQLYRSETKNKTQIRLFFK